MKTAKEKKIEIALLTEKIERMSGKKVKFLENSSSSLKGALLQIIDEDVQLMEPETETKPVTKPTTKPDVKPNTTPNPSTRPFRPGIHTEPAPAKALLMKEESKDKEDKNYVAICEWEEDGKDEWDVVKENVTKEQAIEAGNKAKAAWLKENPETYKEQKVKTKVITKKQYEEKLKEE
jgi:hypothetical protein